MDFYICSYCIVITEASLYGKEYRRHNLPSDDELPSIAGPSLLAENNVRE